ncbi:MAG: hypothetical protein AAF957_23560 [Planctomycetota bacterium]
MNESNEPDLSARLLAADSATAPGSDPAITLLVEQERSHERRVRRAAIVAWSGALTALPVLGIAMATIRSGGGASVEAARVLLVVFGAVFVLATLVALMTTIAWLSRPRAASLAAIDRRLARLEGILLDLG